MKECGRSGVSMRNWLFILVQLPLLFGSIAEAGEFGNAMNSNEARRASAQALSGLSKIFAALEQRELQNIDKGKEYMISAAQALRQASDDMHRIKIEEENNRNISYEKINKIDIEILEIEAHRLDQ